MSGNAILKELVTASKAGRPAGICSVCSANEYVIEAAMEETLASGGGVSDRGNGKPGQPVWRLYRNDTG